MEIVVLDGYVENPGDLSWDGFSKFGELTVYDRTPADKIIERIGDSKIVLTNKTPITQETIKACNNIEYVGLLSTGYNVIDLEAAKDANIVVTNIPGYSTESVAQFVFALLLEYCHHIGHHSEEVKKGRWAKSEDFAFWDTPMVELEGKTLGIFGYGSIGRAVARIARAFMMNVICYSPSKAPGLEMDGVSFVSFEEMLQFADVITLHAPLTEKTNGIIDAKAIAKMKDGAVLINTARGPLINEANVEAALESGKLAAALMDVMGKEPPEEGNSLIENKHTIVTPHIAWASKEARARLMDIAVENLRAFLAGEPQNVVHP